MAVTKRILYLGTLPYVCLESSKSMTKLAQFISL